MQKIAKMAIMNSTTTNPSIYIPRLFPNHTPDNVRKVFDEAFGVKCVDRVDLVNAENKNGEKYKRGFVHFRFWPESVAETKQDLLDGNDVKIVYREPWYWKCLLSNLEKPVLNSKKMKGKGKGKSYIMKGGGPRSPAVDRVDLAVAVAAVAEEAEEAEEVEEAEEADEVKSDGDSE